MTLLETLYLVAGGAGMTLAFVGLAVAMVVFWGDPPPRDVAPTRG